MAGWATMTIVTSSSSMNVPAHTASSVHHFLSIGSLRRQAPSPAPFTMLRQSMNLNPQVGSMGPDFDARYANTRGSNDARYAGPPDHPYPDDRAAGVVPHHRRRDRN